MVNINERLQFYLPLARLSTSGMSHPAFTPQPQRITALRSVLISRTTEGRRLSWLGKKEDRHLVTYRGGFAVGRR